MDGDDMVHVDCHFYKFYTGMSDLAKFKIQNRDAHSLQSSHVGNGILRSRRSVWALLSEYHRDKNKCA